MPPAKPSTADLADLIAEINHLSPEQRNQLYLGLLATRDAMGPVVPGLMTHPIRAREGPALDTRAWADGTHLRTAVQTSIMINLYDLDGVLPPLGESFTSMLEAHLAKLDGWTDTLRGHLTQNRIAFRIRIPGHPPSKKERYAMSSLAFPIYFIDDSKMQPLQSVLDIMDEHGVPEIIPGTGKKAIRTQVQDDWNGGIRGVTVPPGTLVRGRRSPRCTFMKGKLMAHEAQGDPTYYANMVAHEFGHACNIFGAGAHPSDGSVMEPKKATSQLKAELYGYNKKHATLIVSFLVAISRLAIVVALGFSVGCRPPPPSTSGACVPAPDLDLTCAGCDEPSQLDAKQAKALATEVVRAVVTLEVDRGVLTDDVGKGEALRYFAIPNELRDDRLTGVPMASGVVELDRVAKEQPRRFVYFIQLDPLGFAGTDRVYLRARTTNHMWTGGEFFDEQTDATYCARKVGQAVDITVVEPPLFLKD